MYGSGDPYVHLKFEVIRGGTLRTTGNGSPAGNTFSPTTTIAVGNFFNATLNNIKYYYSDVDANANPVNYSPGGLVSPTPLHNIHATCPTGTIGTSGSTIHLGTLSSSSLLSQFLTFHAVLQNTQNEYKSLIDGGNTTAMVSFLGSHNLATDSNLVDSVLLLISPWVSSQALLQAANSTNSLSTAKLFQVLYANPDGIDNQSLIDLLKAKGTAGTPRMGDTLIDSLIDHKDSITVRTLLEDSITQANLLRNEAAYEVIARMYQDTDSLSYDSLRLWLYNLQLPEADVEVAQSYVETGNLDSATNVMARIYSKYTLTAYDSTRLNNTDSVLSNFIIPWYDANDSVLLSLDTSQLQLLDSFATQNSQHLPGTNCVRNLLNAYNSKYFTSPVLPADSNTERSLTVNTQTNQNETKQPAHQGIKVYPNPANNYVKFELDSSNANTTLTVYDLYGRKVIENSLNGQTQTTINTESWQPGIFVWQVKQNGYPVGQDKLEIIK